MKGKMLLSIALCWILAACGTVKTVVQHDTTIARSLKEVSTRCNAIPRIYSGTAYNFCFMTGKPELELSTSFSRSRFHMMGVDILFSGIFDTVLLPYSVYQQINQGSIDVR